MSKSIRKGAAVEPQWHQDTSTKGIQPKHLPHFEVAGPQLDWEGRKKASQIAVSVLGLTSVFAIVIILIAFVPKSLDSQRTFAQMPKSSTTQIERHRNKILISVNSVRRANAFPGKLFMTNRARDGFTFLLLEMTITNRSGDAFGLNPFSFKVFMTDGASFTAALSTTSHPDAIKSRSLTQNDKVRGTIVFQVPANARPDSLELLGATGTIATVQL